MKNYELMYIVDPSAEEGGEAIKQKIEGMITGREGIIQSFEKLGKKRLAYLIKKRQYGIYYLAIFKGNGTIIQALVNYLLLNSLVLRHIVLALSDKALKLRSETDRIQLEEAERMRMGGKPLLVKDEEDEAKDSKPVSKVKKDNESTDDEATSVKGSKIMTEEIVKEEKKSVPVEDQTPEPTDVKESGEETDSSDNGEVQKDQTVG